jgi:hypothetical protein
MPPEAEALADRIVRFGMAIPAILFLESMRPLNTLGANALHFMSPMMAPLMPGLGIDELAKFFESRGSVEQLICAIEQREAAMP